MRQRGLSRVDIGSVIRYLCGLLLVVAPLTTAGDWPTSLHDPQRTAGSTDEITLSTSTASQLSPAWAFATGGAVAASAASVGPTVYVGSWDGYEYALDAATGAQKWRTFLGITNANPICFPATAGISSAAAVQDGVVYVGGGDAYWYALDANTGAVLWKVFTGDNSAASGHYNWSSPLLYGGYAYIGVSSVGDCPLVQGQLIQVSLSTHQVVNTFDLVPTGQVGGGIWTSPSVDPATNTIFVATGTINDPSQTYAQAIVAFDATTLDVKSSWQLPQSQTVFDSDWGTSATLLDSAAGDKFLAVTNKNGYVYEFNRNDLEAGPLWRQLIAAGGGDPVSGDGSVASAAVGNGKLFVAGGNTTINGSGYPGGVRALDPVTGNFLWQRGLAGPVIPALAYANGLVYVAAGAALEVLDANTGTVLYTYATGGPLYGAPSIANGRVLVGSTDGHVYAFGLPATAPSTPIPDPNCQTGWSCRDIGNPAPAGAETISGGTWSITVGGAGVTDTADQFRLLGQGVTGDAQVSARLISQSATPTTAQAGLMVRQSNNAGSPYYAALLSPQHQLTVQYRSRLGGATAVASQITVGAPPLYVEIQRRGDQLQAATSSDGMTYTLVPGSTVTVVLPAAVTAGLAVSSSSNGTGTSVTFSNVAAGPTGAQPVAPSTACPTGWSCADIGNPALPGGQSLGNGTWTMQGAGTDIADYADQFHFVWQTLAADASVSSRVVSQSNTNAEAKAGIMLRQSIDPGSLYYGVFVTPGDGILVQYRASQGLRSTTITSVPGTVPAYVEVTRSGNTYSAYTSADGATWTFVIGTSVTLNTSGAVLGGMAVTSANAATLGTVTFDTLSIGSTAPPPPGDCPATWACADIGTPTPGGTQSLIGNTFTIQGGGGDIWSTADQFHFVWQSLASDGTFSAHVASQSNSNDWAKAGVMLRQNGTDAGAAFYAVYVTPANGITVQYRATPGGSAAQATALTGSAPAYMRVARSGSTFTAYTSTDGVTWTLMPGSGVTLPMSGTLLAGMAVTSHNTIQLSTVAFDKVALGDDRAAYSDAHPATAVSQFLTCADIGTPTPGGTQSLIGNTFTIQGGGGDIWSTADQFHFVWQSLASDGTFSAHVASQSNSNDWAKAGVMLRQNGTDPGAAFYAVYATPANGITVQYRATPGGSAAQATALTGSVPAYMRVARSGSTFTAYTSTDGVTWTLMPGSGVTLPMSGTLLAGMAVTSHNTIQLSTVAFDKVALGTTAPPTPTPTPPPPCPSSWTCADIGTPTPGGTQSLIGNTFTIQGGGGDIWSTADQFHFVWQSLASDGTFSAHVASQSNSDGWAKAGVMLRQNSTDPGAAFYAVYATPANGITVQYRATPGGSAAQATALTGSAPAYMRVARSGSTFTAYTSADGVTWTLMPGSGVTLPMSGTLLAGMAVTSHNTIQLSTVAFDKVALGTTAPPTPTPTPPPPCPSSWTCADIGTPTPGGTQSLIGNTFTIQGGGGDIWSTADQFHFVWQSLASDGTFSAHVASQSNSNDWAKAGVMLRQNGTDPGAAFYAVYVTPANGITVQYRATPGGSAAQATALTGSVPAYMRVARSGSTFTAYTSTDGVTWTLMPGSVVTLPMSGTLLAGMAVTSHNVTAIGTAVFDNIAVAGAAPSTTPTPTGTAKSLSQSVSTATLSPTLAASATRPLPTTASPTATPSSTTTPRPSATSTSTSTSTATRTAAPAG